MSEEMTGPTPVNAVSEDVPTNDATNPVTARGQRRKTWFAVAAAVAAGSVLIGSGGYALGTMSETPTAGKTERGALAPTTQAPGVPSLIPVKGTSTGAAMVAYPQLVQPDPGTVFVASSALSGDTGRAPAYAFSAARVDAVPATKRLALALSDRHQVVLSSDNTAYVAKTRYQDLTVRLDGALSFTFDNQTPDKTSCTYVYKNRSVVSVTGAIGGNPTPQTFADYETCFARQSAADPHALSALAVSHRVMLDAGFDPKNYRWGFRVNPYTNDATVTAIPKVDGHQLPADESVSDTSWRFEVYPGGRLTRAYGALAPVVSLGQYRIVSERGAVDRLNYSRYLTRLPTNADGTLAAFPDSYSPSNARPANGASDRPWSGETPSPKPTLPTAPLPGSKLQWPLTSATIVKATLGLASYRQSNGALVLMPTYTLTQSNGARYSVLAVDDTALHPALR